MSPLLGRQTGALAFGDLLNSKGPTLQTRGQVHGVRQALDLLLTRGPWSSLSDIAQSRPQGRSLCTQPTDGKIEGQKEGCCKLSFLLPFWPRGATACFPRALMKDGVGLGVVC